jgi:serine/threonine protein kinase
MATGNQPFQGTTTGVIFNEILTKAPISPVRINPEVHDELEHIINKALEKDREVRYQSSKELLADLKRLGRNTDSGKSALASAVPSPAPKRLKKILWPVAGSLALVLALIIAWFWVKL